MCTEQRPQIINEDYYKLLIEKSKADLQKIMTPDFTAKSFELKDKYRNKAAHPDNIQTKFSQDEAETFRILAKEWFTLWLAGLT